MKSGSPNDNVWKLLVVTTVFKDIDLLLELVLRYDEITHEVKEINGRVFLRINVDSIREAFNLHSLEEANYSVNLEMFGKEFDNAGIEVNKKMIMAFVKEVSGVKLSPAAIKHKLADCDNYNDTLVNTHTTLYQVVDLQNNNKFTHATMWIC